MKHQTFTDSANVLALVDKVAKKYGYAGAEYVTTWNGYRVFDPIYGTDKPSCVGLPFVFLEHGGEVRLSSEDEAMDFLAVRIKLTSRK